MSKINVLSLFDGMSCGQLALQRAKIPVGKYYSSELDKHAMAVTKSNFPDTIFLGDINKWREWDIDWAAIDLIWGGSPCQGFSFAGKQLNFDDPRSRLFFVFVEILNHIKKLNPNVVFLLENVKMKKIYEDVITKNLGVDPIQINSALVSAQNRKRLYWTNIKGVQVPEDRNIMLFEILESGIVDRHKSFCLDANYHKGGNLKQYFDKSRRQLVFEKIGVAKNGKGIYLSGDEPVPFTFYETRTEEGKRLRREMSKKLGRDTTPRDKNSKMYKPLLHGKANCLVTVDSFLNYVLDSNYELRKLTPVECERLQTVPDNYTSVVSDSQRYRMLGNGWTVDVIAGIISTHSFFI